MRSLALTIVSAIIGFVLAVSTAPAATADRTWVSHSGAASNASLTPPCSEQSPCDTFATAIGVTNAGGEIDCLDNGGYGPVTITQSVTINCGQLGAIGVSGSSSAITINGSNILVTLRSLMINGNGSAGAGVEIDNGASVTIEDCLIQNFSNGIFDKSSSALLLNVSNTLLVSAFNGILVSPPSGNPSVYFVADRVRVENSGGVGIGANGFGSTGLIKGFVRDSVVSGSSGATGISAQTSAGAAPTTVMVSGSYIVNNGIGVASNGTAAVILGNSTIQGNGTALNSSSGGAIFSYGNNNINDNQPGGLGSTPTPIGQH
jgi:hypothetical protein